jgi:hypothetical protein
MFKIEEFTLIGSLTINLGLITISIAGLILFFARYPAKFERLVAYVNKFFLNIIKSSEYTYIKYDIQGRLNEFISKTDKKVPHLDALKAKIEWVDEKQSAENFIKNGTLIIRMQRSDNQNKNLVNASMAFISGCFLKKAKSYIADYQKNAIDLYACYDLLKLEKRELLDQFAQDFLKNSLTNKKIGDFFEKFMDMDKAGLFYPLFVQELTFFGEKVFTKKRDGNKIFDEISKLVFFLYNYSQKKMGEDLVSEFNGEYCKFAIRIIGKSHKINTLGETAYKNNLSKLPKGIETLYLIGSLKNKDFVKKVYLSKESEIGFEVLEEKSYSPTIKDRDGNDMLVDTYLLIARKKTIKVVHRE